MRDPFNAGDPPGARPDAGARPPVAARDGSLAAGLIAGALFGAEFLLIYRGFSTHHGVAGRAVHLSRAVLRGDRRPLRAAGRPLQRDAMAGAAARLRRHDGGIRRAGAGVLAASAPGRPDDGRSRLGLGGDHVGHQDQRAVARVAGKDAALSARGLRADRDARRAPVGERIAAMPSAVALGSLAYQTIVVGATFSLWFALIVKFSANRLSAFTFLTPLFGVAAGHLVLGEPLTPAFALAVALVAGGLILVNRPR